MTRTVVNVGLYNVCWLATAYGAGAGMPLLGPVFVGFAMVVHVIWIQRSLREFVFLSLLLPVGFGLDTLVIAGGFLEFPPGQGYGPFPPLWMGGLWLIFGTLFDRSLRWLISRPILAAGLGALGGPLAYYAGLRFDAILFPHSFSLTLLVLAVEWMVAMSLLVFLARRSLSLEDEPT